MVMSLAWGFGDGSRDERISGSVFCLSTAFCYLIYLTYSFTYLFYCFTIKTIQVNCIHIKKEDPETATDP